MTAPETLSASRTPNSSLRTTGRTLKTRQSFFLVNIARKNFLWRRLTISQGMPALWDPPSEAMKLPQDSGRYFRDQNAARHPKHPMEPAVKAVLTQNPHFNTEAVDVFGCTSTLGNLLRFLKSDDKTFRFTVETVGRTVFFVRRENAPDELIAGPRGFGPTGHGMLIPCSLCSSKANSCRSHLP